MAENVSPARTYEKRIAARAHTSVVVSPLEKFRPLHASARSLTLWGDCSMPPQCPTLEFMLLSARSPQACLCAIINTLVKRMASTQIINRHTICVELGAMLPTRDVCANVSAPRPRVRSTGVRGAGLGRSGTMDITDRLRIQA